MSRSVCKSLPGGRSLKDLAISRFLPTEAENTSLDAAFKLATKFKSNGWWVKFSFWLCRPGAYLSDSRYDSHFILANLSVLPQAEESREGEIQRQFKLTVPITFQTSQTEYLTLLPFDKW